MADVNLWLLVGIAIVVVGFFLKLDSIAVVLIAAVVTALIGGMKFNEILALIGKSFVGGRGASIFIITLPIIGISERYGLREQAVKLIQRIGNLTAGRVLWVYNIIRQFAAAFSLRLGGHPQFIRPLVHPMAEAAAQSELGEGQKLDEKSIEEIKAAAAASENYGNFFGQNMFAAASGVVLMASTLSENNIQAQPTEIAMWSLPVFITVLILSGIQFTLLDRKIRKRGKN
ncbi:DUF969 domain-containing protein [Erysipelothrix urinaevulpis]|uniref:DUF969 domain-containing protein n=1 Tax=Erysipelothrix urinaevulpis TaxID=2683717 RepID=UPI0013573E80|nr:DUF969 domain-containing protein [Erysipelothrix urinaevulpis]